MNLPFDFQAVHFMHLIARMGKEIGEFAVIGQKKQSRRIFIEPSDRKYALCSRNKRGYVCSPHFVRNRRNNAFRFIYEIIDELRRFNPFSVQLYIVFSGIYSEAGFCRQCSVDRDAFLFEQLCDISAGTNTQMGKILIKPLRVCFHRKYYSAKYIPLLSKYKWYT